MNVFNSRRDVAAMLIGYFERMCEPKPFRIRAGAEFAEHQRALRETLLACAGLWPLPERVPLDMHASEPLEHEWCSVRRISYQLWPNVYSTGLLYMPKQLPEHPAPAVLCPHGHWQNGNAHPSVQTRCLVLAKMGYVVFASTQNHYEDTALGVSHQTLMIWNNMRALDYLQSLPEVDPDRIGCTGASGGGLQTQMLVAVDERVKVASICGMTCDYREIVFAGRNHCRCNHFPDIMRYTDEPELSALGLPAAVQYLTMNDWTRSFERDNLPTIRRLYEAHGLSDHVDCKYWPTGHSYDQPKRERMYWWMEKWLRGKDHGEPIPEPATEVIPVEALEKLQANVPGNKGFGATRQAFSERFRFAAPAIADRAAWAAYRQKMRAALQELLGTDAAPPKPAVSQVSVEQRDGVCIERVLCPSEEGISIPVLVLRPAASQGKLPGVVLCDGRGKAALLADEGAGAPIALAQAGSVVLLPDVRFIGELALAAFAGLSKELLTFKACCPLAEHEPEQFDRVWERNALLWGRPVPGMATTDILAVLRYVASRPDVDQDRISLVGRGTLAVPALFAAALDDRAQAIDLDLAGQCFEMRKLPLVPFILQHGDVLQWAALMADRQLKLTGVPKQAGDPNWLEGVFAAVGNGAGLTM